jgi:hypothetical protein
MHAEFRNDSSTTPPLICSVRSSVHGLLLAVSTGAALLGLGASSAQALTNVVIKSFEGAWSVTV